MYGSAAVRATYRGRPLAGSLVRAWRRPVGARERPFDPATRDSVGPVAEAHTDRDGIARLGRVAAVAAEKVAAGGRPTAYVCEKGLCRLPAIEPEKPAAQIAPATPYA